MKKPTYIWMLTVWILFPMLVTATDYMLDPMNYEPGNSRQMSVVIDSPGDNISVSIPAGFTLYAGSNNGTSYVTFIVLSPNSSINGDMDYFNIYLNGIYYNRMTALSVPDIQIVDNKWEIGHGDFNYPTCNYIPNETTLLFPIIRVWPVGNDVLGEPANNVSFTCQYPLIRPRTVDSKFTTVYNPTNLQATGALDDFEGASMFRVFVLSQEVSMQQGDTYNVNCTQLTYDFTHHRIRADIAPISIDVVNTTPFIVTTSTTNEYVEYEITSIAPYEIRDIDFEWQMNDLVQGTKKDSMIFNETVRYRVWANGNPTINFNIRFEPCWMFESRAPTIYDSSFTGTYLINSNSTEFFSLDEKIYDKIKKYGESNIVDISRIIFLLEANSQLVKLDVYKMPTEQQTEANFTCFRLELSSTGVTDLPTIKLQTPADTASDVILKDKDKATLEFDFTRDQDGYGIVEYEQQIDMCTPENIDPTKKTCPVVFNYICLKNSVLDPSLQPPQLISIKKEEAKPFSFFDWLMGIGKVISPTYPGLGFMILLGIIGLLLYMYYFHGDEVGDEFNHVREWITLRKQRTEREKYEKWLEKEKEKRYGGGGMY